MLSLFGRSTTSNTLYLHLFTLTFSISHLHFPSTSQVLYTFVLVNHYLDSPLNCFVLRSRLIFLFPFILPSIPDSQYQNNYSELSTSFLHLCRNLPLCFNYTMFLPCPPPYPFPVRAIPTRRFWEDRRYNRNNRQTMAAYSAGNSVGMA